MGPRRRFWLSAAPRTLSTVVVWIVLQLASTGVASAQGPSCPTDLGPWRRILGAEWIDCHRVADLTTTGNPFTDPNSLTGMGSPPPSSGALQSKYSNPTTPPVSGLQIDGYFPDACNAFQAEPALVAKDGSPFIPGCTPPPVPGRTCLFDCHHDGQFVLRIPDSWDGHLLSAGTPGIRDAFASDFILSDYALEKRWAYVSQDKGNMGANFFRSGTDESGTAGTPWIPGAAIREWTVRMRQATRAARALLTAIAPEYGLKSVTRSYIAGISNGGYQTRRALETDSARDHLYDGGVDWEGTLFLSRLPAFVSTAMPTTGFNLFTYLPTALANAPGDLLGQPDAVTALAEVGFNPDSQPLWPYHWTIYWGLRQKIYRLEFDPEFTGYTCSDPLGVGPSCVAPPALVVPSTDPDASYDYALRVRQNPAILSRIDAVANTGDIQRPLITLHGDQDALLPILTDSDIYAQLVAYKHKTDRYRYYIVQGGNHVDPQFDDHYGVDEYGTTVLRPMLPCVRAALDALAAWVEQHVPPPSSHTIPRPQNASASDLANTCSLE
jgi:Alpha/beta hydrolase domain